MICRPSRRSVPNTCCRRSKRSWPITVKPLPRSSKSKARTPPGPAWCWPWTSSMTAWALPGARSATSMRCATAKSCVRPTSPACRRSVPTLPNWARTVRCSRPMRHWPTALRPQVSMWRKRPSSSMHCVTSACRASTCHPPSSSVTPKCRASSASWAAVSPTNCSTPPRPGPSTLPTKPRLPA
ncbi:hypothetical protein D3C75_953260 [compost metagenome]